MSNYPGAWTDAIVTVLSSRGVSEATALTVFNNLQDDIANSMNYK